MKISYYPEVDMLYIGLANQPSVDSDEVRPGVVLDFGADDQVVGIEIEHASKHIDLASFEVNLNA